MSFMAHVYSWFAPPKKRRTHLGRNKVRNAVRAAMSYQFRSTREIWLDLGSPYKLGSVRSALHTLALMGELERVFTVAKTNARPVAFFRKRQAEIVVSGKGADIRSKVA